MKIMTLTKVQDSFPREASHLSKGRRRDDVGARLTCPETAVAPWSERTCEGQSCEGHPLSDGFWTLATRGSSPGRARNTLYYKFSVEHWKARTDHSSTFQHL